jgi:hypothetical protein
MRQSEQDGLNCLNTKVILTITMQSFGQQNRNLNLVNGCTGSSSISLAPPIRMMPLQPLLVRPRTLEWHRPFLLQSMGASAVSSASALQGALHRATTEAQRLYLQMSIVISAFNPVVAHRSPPTGIFVGSGSHRPLLAWTAVTNKDWPLVLHCSQPTTTQPLP